MYGVCRLKRNPTTITYCGTKWNQEHVHPFVIFSLNLPFNTRVKDTLLARPLLMPAAPNLCKFERLGLQSDPLPWDCSTKTYSPVVFFIDASYSFQPTIFMTGNWHLWKWHSNHINVQWKSVDLFKCYERESYKRTQTDVIISETYFSFCGVCIHMDDVIPL
jgi:hypothetical protein